MARIRSVHPSLFTDEAWVSCSLGARLLFIGLWTDADDQGVFEWKPLQLKMRLLPADGVDVSALLKELAGVDLIRQFDVGAIALGGIKDFRKWQRPQKPNAVHPLTPEMRAYVGIDDEDDPADNLRRRLCEAQGNRCYYCEADITHYSKRATSCEVDHKVPRVRGGSDDEENLVAACRSCNRGKCDRTEAEWRAIIASRKEPDLFGEDGRGIGKPMEDGGERKVERRVVGVDVRTARAVPLPDGFPFDDHIRKAEEKFAAEGVDVDARREAEKFRNHHAARGKTFKSWPAAWGTWTGNAIDYAKRDGRLIDRGKVLAIDGALPREEFNLRKWRTWMQDWLSSPFTWDRKRRGAAPDEPGCEIPAVVMAEFGYTPPARDAG